MTREEAYAKLEETIGKYILHVDDPIITVTDWRQILSALKGETNTTNLSVDDWSSDEIKVLKFMVRCAYDMLDCVRDCDGYLDGFDRDSMYHLCCKLGIEDVV